VGPERVDLATFARGYRKAQTRYRRAVGAEHELPSDETFLPLFECLNWSIAAIDLANDLGHPLNDPLVRALCYARDRIDNQQWADALFFGKPPNLSPSETRRKSDKRAARAERWYWRDLADLPVARADRPDATGARAYERHLRGRHAGIALEEFGRVLAGPAQPAPRDPSPGV
jgi:hypothetical protein